MKYPDQRPFSEDYPNAEGLRPGDRLIHDIDGRSIPTTGIRVGRSEVGGDDAPLSPELFDAIATVETGRPISRFESRGREVGGVAVSRETKRPLSVEVSNGLSTAAFDRVAGHEIGHVIDQAAGEIKTNGLNTELRQLYNALNTGQWRQRGLTGPENLGYKGDNVPRELMAEAIRAYMNDPNWIKSVAPKTAARIRKWVNTNPDLSKSIQFNANPSTAATFGLLKPTAPPAKTNDAGKSLYDWLGNEYKPPA